MPSFTLVPRPGLSDATKDSRLVSYRRRDRDSDVAPDCFELLQLVWPKGSLSCVLNGEVAVRSNAAASWSVRRSISGPISAKGCGLQSSRSARYK